MRDYAAAGYSPVPCRNGRPRVGGFHGGAWRYHEGLDERYKGHDVGLLCAARPLGGASGSATLGAVASTWIAGVRVVCPHKKLRSELAAIIQRVAGTAPCRADGDELLFVFKCERPFYTRRLAPVTLPGDKPTSLAYVPTRVEVLSAGAFCVVSGGRWVGGTLPETKRDDLPTLTREQADTILLDVEGIFKQREAKPWL
jgi:hypothetical protein